MARNAAIISARYFFVDLLGGIVFFPLWWYSRGLRRAGLVCIAATREERRALAVGVWVKNLFVPMYGASDFWGRLISFFMRSAQIIGRLFVLVVYTLITVLLLVGYLLLPVLIIWQILFHAVGVLLL